MPSPPNDIPFDLIDQMVIDVAGQPLTKLQRLVLQECWRNQKKTYEEIAAENNYANSYIQQRIAPALWRLLSEAVGTKIPAPSASGKIDCAIDSLLLAYSPCPVNNKHKERLRSF